MKMITIALKHGKCQFAGVKDEDVDQYIKAIAEANSEFVSFYNAVIRKDAIEAIIVNEVEEEQTGGDEKDGK